MTKRKEGNPPRVLFSAMSDAELIAHYQNHFSSMDWTDLKKYAPGLRNRMQKRKLQWAVKREGRSLTDDEVISRAKAIKDSGVARIPSKLYGQLWHRGVSGFVAKKPMTKEEVWAKYQREFSGLTPGQLQKKKGGVAMYALLAKHDLVNDMPRLRKVAVEPKRG
ncbi:MAG: hypothetical protein RLZZ283_527 [Candidatus Parcubacteria bacterium]